jgi:CHAD domain-containing protein
MKKLPPITWDLSKTTAGNVQTVLPELAGSFFAAGRKIVKHKSKPKDLHRFRLLAKRFRYTLELFEPLFGPGLDRRLALLRKIQQFLGDISDCGSTSKLITDAEDDHRVPAAEFHARLEELRRAKTRKLIRFWEREFGDKTEEHWARYFRTYAGRVGGVSRGRR